MNYLEGDLVYVNNRRSYYDGMVGTVVFGVFNFTDWYLLDNGLWFKGSELCLQQ